MKKEIRNLITAFVILLTIGTTVAQNSETKKDKKKKKKEQEEKVVSEGPIKFLPPEVVKDEVAMEEVSSPSNSSILHFEPIKNIRYNDKYDVSHKINDMYDYSWMPNHPNRHQTYGIVDKQGNVILPNIFNKSYDQPNVNDILFYIDKPKYYGLFNLDELRWAIPLIYEELNSLNNNLYSAKKEGKWGVIDNHNQIVIPFEWTKITRISNLENYVMVTSKENNGVYSIIEKKFTVPCEYSNLQTVDGQNNFLVTKSGKSNIVNIDNVPVFKKWYTEIKTTSRTRNYYIVKDNNFYGVIDQNEKTLIPIEYLEFGSYSYSDGSYLAKNKEGKYGFILLDGRVTLPFKYDQIKQSNGNNMLSFVNGKCGLVQVNSGTPLEITTCDYDDIETSSKSFMVQKEGKFGVLDEYGKLIINTEYESLDVLKGTDYYGSILGYISKKGNKYQLLDEMGKAISSVFYEMSPLYRILPNSYRPQFNYLKVKDSNGKYGIIDKVGKAVIKPQFEDVSYEIDNVAIVKNKNKCGVYSMLNQKMLVDYEYDNIIRSDSYYLGFNGKNIDMIVINSDIVTKTSTIK